MKKLGCTMCILAFSSFSTEIGELKDEKARMHHVHSGSHLPLHRRTQFGIRGHGRHSMDSLLAERCSGCNFALRLFSDLQGYQMEPSMIRDGTPSSARETCSECVCVYVHIKES